MILLYVL